MKIDGFVSDQALMAELGQRVARRRLDLELSQARLAREAGISKRTLERLEAGASVQLDNFLRVLRVLDLLDGLNLLVPSSKPRPLELLHMQGKQRQRAPSERLKTETPSNWQWDEST